MTTRKRLTISLAPHQFEFVRQEAERLDIPISEVMRRILDDLAKQKRKAA